MHLNLIPLNWQRSSAQFCLEPNQIHLWLADTDEVSHAQLQDLSECLSLDEQQRATKFRFEVHRRRFIASRGMVRSLLGYYLNCASKMVQFNYDAYGKPQVLPPDKAPSLNFNISHSGSLTLVAITQHRVGVDLEQHRDIANLTSLAQRFFTAREYEAIQALPAAQQPTAFFQYWTGKEALLKGLGVGLSGLSQVELKIADGQVEWLNPEQFHSSQQKWMVQLFTPASNFTGAIAVETEQSIEIACWQWFWELFQPD